ncbi:hypothetical protein SAMN05421823_102491 [Catalinimonas alkaloidigena]|uniref:Uncharacterized protein n=1 Tax=Catalinimonas alkaloidigena TaxID=1075417 RepID=A0A1G9B2J0_9BACT|nr:hypothetical protein [Catalinimonas alkaloidigena]SDK33769.1 hypothetical protein SAMN05421823_102491 [Catalinimonas alkaloidigena]
MKQLTFWVLVLFPLLGQAQTPLSERWLRGVVVLNNGDTTRGKLNYNTETETLRLDANSSLKTYSTQQVNLFSLYDEESGQTRLFRSLPFRYQSDYERPTFFEVLEDGQPLQLLGRERMSVQSVPVYDPFMNRTYYTNRMQLTNDFFFRENEGRIRQYLGRKREVYLLLSDRKKEVKAFVKRNNLRFDRERDLVEIVKYYNQLKNG